MDAEELKKAERRGYARGYEAGKRKKVQRDNLDLISRQKQAFLDRAFLAVLPAAMNAQGWQFGDGKPTTSTPDRVQLAAFWAREALKQRPLT